MKLYTICTLVIRVHITKNVKYIESILIQENKSFDY